MRTIAVALAAACAASLVQAAPAPEEAAPDAVVDASVADAAPPGPLVVSGSSTVAPFALVLSSEIEDIAVRVASTGTTAGLSALCDLHPGSADLTGASRPIRPGEIADCAAAEISTIVEVPLGRDGIVLAQSADAPAFSLTARDLYRALAARVPKAADDCTMVPNRTRAWRDVREELPDRRIAVYGPPLTSGTREVFAERTITAGARTEPCLVLLERTDPDAFRAALRLRRDGAWAEAGENDGAIAFALTRLPGAIGVFGLVHAGPQEGLTLLPFGGVHPNAQTVADGRYQLSRPLFLYTTAGHLTRDPRVIEVVRAFAGPEATGPSGTLTAMGLAHGARSGRAYLIDTRDGTRTELPLGH